MGGGICGIQKFHALSQTESGVEHVCRCTLNSIGLDAAGLAVAGFFSSSFLTTGEAGLGSSLARGAGDVGRASSRDRLPAA